MGVLMYCCRHIPLECTRELDIRQKAMRNTGSEGSELLREFCEGPLSVQDYLYGRNWKHKWHLMENKKY